MSTVFLLINIIATMSSKPSLTYHVKMDNPSTHYFTVDMYVGNIKDDIVTIKMPVWTPGSYLIREYAKNVDYVVAKDDAGNALLAKKIDKNTWEIQSDKKDFTFSYSVYAFEESVRTCFLDDTHAAIVPAALFMYVDTYDLPSTLYFHPYKDWKNISTSLDMVANDPWVRYAPNKDLLYDSPVEIGNQDIYHFTAAGVDHEISMYGAGNYDITKLLSDFTKIVDEEEKIFGEHPCKKYTVFIQNLTNGGGGLEHQNSTSLITKRFNYQPENNYTGFLGLFSHEYFHLWNAKRLRPIALGPFNYNQENYTPSLWIVEGFTAYYDDLILRRAQLITTTSYLTIVEGNITTVENTPGNAVQSVAEASFDAWIKYYRTNENSNNTQVNYYTKGATLAMLLDLEILHNSNGKYALDDVMKYMYTEYYKKLNRGYTEAEFKAGLEKFADENLDWFYTKYVSGTEPIDYNKFFTYAGLDITNVNMRAIESDLGITVNALNIVTAVRKNSSGEKGGINVNDELIAINDYRYTTATLSASTLNKKEGDMLQITVSRNSILKTYPVTLQYSDKAAYKLTQVLHATEDQKNIYKKWLHTDTYN